MRNDRVENTGKFDRTLKKGGKTVVPLVRGGRHFTFWDENDKFLN